MLATYRLPLEECEVVYYPNFIGEDVRNDLMLRFEGEFDWEIRKVLKLKTLKQKTRDSVSDGGDLSSSIIYKLNRATCVFGDDGVVPPDIWGEDVVVNRWTPELLDIKNRIETLTGKRYNICLCNYYKTGKHSIGFHSDNEERGSTSSIASISLGTERPFIFKRISCVGDDTNNPRYTQILENGSLLIMGEGTQENYQHSVPADKSITTPRINLTFRLFDAERYGMR